MGIGGGKMSRKHLKHFVFTALIGIVFSACNADTNILQKEIDCIHYYKNYYEDFYEVSYLKKYTYTSDYNAKNIKLSFYGRWILENIAVQPSFFWDEGGNYYSMPIDIGVYLGYEMIFAPDYIRLKERVMTYPNYQISETMFPVLSINYHRDTIEKVFGHFDSHEDLIEMGLSVANRTITRNSDYYLLFHIMPITYPSYPELWLRGYFKLDPLLIEHGMHEFHPLFRRITVLSEDYILIGWREKVLARRIY